MTVSLELVRPDTLVEGNTYLRLEKVGASKQMVLVPVMFIAYQPCPALVIVKSKDDTIRCPREELFNLLSE